MKTPHLDNLINDLKAYDRNDMLSDDGRNQLNEYEAIKRALSIANVVGQSEQLPCSDLFFTRLLAIKQMKNQGNCLQHPIEVAVK